MAWRDRVRNDAVAFSTVHRILRDAGMLDPGAQQFAAGVRTMESNLGTVHVHGEVFAHVAQRLADSTALRDFYTKWSAHDACDRLLASNAILLELGFKDE